MPTVQVLISTYNGEKYISEQLDSILRQDYKYIDILIRDDGSTDDTVQIISKKILSHSTIPIQFYVGENIGVINSFFDLLETASEDASYYALCDQDDIWLKKKLSTAVSKLIDIPENVPAIYCSRAELVDENLNTLGYWPSIPKRNLDFSNALVQNIAVGCTIVLNKAAMNLILKCLPDTKKIIMHDWWIYLCTSAFGRVLYDRNTLIKYRQHDSNVMGGTRNPILKLKKRINNFVENGFQQRYKEQAIEFYKLYSYEIPEVKLNILEEFIVNKPLIERIKYAFSGSVYRQSKIGNILLKCLLIMGRY